MQPYEGPEKDWRGPLEFLQEFDTKVVKYLRSNEEVINDIEPYEGPEDDSRNPLSFIQEFETKVAKHLQGNDRISAEKFISLIERSEWCSTWVHNLKIDMSYRKMREIFKTREWTTEVRDLYYTQFIEENRDNSKFTNFLDYFNYWIRKLDGTRYGEKNIVDRLRENLPARIRVNSLKAFKKVKTIEAFARVINEIPYDDLEWTPPPTIAQRKEALAEMAAKNIENE